MEHVDFGSSFRREGGTRGRNNKGLVTMDRKIKKDAYYVYKAWLSPEPFVHIDGRRYFARPGAQTTIRIHSNQSEVSLYAGGQLVGTQTGAHVFVFEDVPLSREGTGFDRSGGGLHRHHHAQGRGGKAGAVYLPGFSAGAKRAQLV